MTAPNGVLRQNGYSRTSAVDGVRDAARAIAALAPSVSQGVFIPVRGFVGDGGVDAELDGVSTCRVESLLELLTSRPVALSQELLGFLRFDLDMSTRAATDAGAASLAMPHTPRVANTSVPYRRRATIRIPRALRRFVFGIGLWWLACIIVFLTVGLATHNVVLVGWLYIASAVLSTVAALRVIRD